MILINLIGSKMIYVGTVHGDLKGKERLSKLIGVHKPRVISFEYPSHWKVEEVYKKILFKSRARVLGLGLLPRTNRTKLFQLIAQASEFEGRAAGICKQTGLDVRFIDMPGIINIPSGKKKRSDYDGMREDELIERYNRLKDAAYFDGADDVYAEEMAKIMGYDLVGGRVEYDKEKREEYLAEKIRELRPDMHVSGADHIFRSPKSSERRNLWERANQPGDIQVRLIEADKI